MTDERIAEIRRLCEAATPGPWGVFQTTPFEPVVVNSPTGDVCTCDEYEHRSDEREPDAHFIAAARTAVPELLAECERLRAALTDACDCWQAHLDGFVKRTGGDGGSRSEQAHLDRLRAKGQP